MRVAGVAVASLGLAMALGACDAAVRNPTPVPTTRPTIVVVPPTSSPPPTERPSPPPATTFREWTRIDMPDPAPGVYGGGTPSSVVAFKGRYVSAGTVATDCCDASDPASRRGVIWTSVDGRSWTVHDSIGAFEHATIGLLTDGSRLIAVGSYALPVPNEPNAAVWTSQDGETWVRTTGEAPTFVAVAAHGMVGAVVHEQGAGSSSIRFVSSTDGLAWTATSKLFDADLRGLAVAADGQALAIGAVPGTPRSDGSPTTDMVRWASVDGAAWTGPVTIGHAALPISLVSDGSAFVAAICVDSQLPNGSISCETRLWRFSAGAEPIVASIPIGEEEGLERVDVVDGKVFAIGSALVDDVAHLLIWISSDGGLSWDRVPDQEAIRGIGNEIDGLLAKPDGLLAVGRRWDDVSMHPLPEAWLAVR